MNKDFIEILYDNKKIVGIVLIVLVIGIICLTFLFSNKEEEEIIPEVVTINLNLFGSENITINQGEEYDEPGFYAVSSKGVLETSRVEVSNNLDINTPGTYTITYKIDDAVMTRTITVLANEEKEPEGVGDIPSTLSFTLLGEEKITLSLGSSYEEPGYKAMLDEIDVTGEVEVSGSVDTSKAGEYTLTYSIEENNERKELTRTITVVDDRLELNLEYNSNNYSNSRVTITAKVESNNFLMLTLPNMVVASTKVTSYDVTENGTYTFTAYNNDGKMVSKSIEVKTIDKEAPTATCSAVINEESKTTITVSANDTLSGIQSYSFYNNNELIESIESNNLTVDTKLENIKVRAYDKAGNYREVGCTLTDNSKDDRTDNKLILIGDSRTVGMCSSYCKGCKGDKVIAKGGMAYSWFNSTAISTTNKYLNNHSDQSYNIIVLMGVNDVSTTASAGKNAGNRYYKRVEKLANNAWKDQYIYFVSVTAVIDYTHEHYRNVAINAFNKAMKSGIEASNLKNLKYCDVNSQIKVTSSNAYDGLHYTCSFSKKIYNLILKCLED